MQYSVKVKALISQPGLAKALISQLLIHAEPSEGIDFPTSCAEVVKALIFQSLIPAGPSEGIGFPPLLDQLG